MFRTHNREAEDHTPSHQRTLSIQPTYLAPTPFIAALGFFALAAGSLTPTAPLLNNLLRFKYSSTTPSTLPRSCFGFLK